MSNLQNIIFRAVDQNEAAFLEPITSQNYSGHVSIPTPEYMGTIYPAAVGNMVINKLTGLPSVVMDIVQNNQPLKLITDDQRLIFRALKDARLGQEFLHRHIINQKGKVFGAFDATDEMIVAGNFAGMTSLPTMDVAAHGDIYLLRGQELVTDNSMKYIYNELLAINGVFDSQPTDKPSATMLFKNGLDKANEALTPLKGDGLQILLRRLSTFQSLILFEFNKNPQVFLGMVQEFLAAVQTQKAQGGINTQTMQTAGTADKLLADRSILAKCVMEEAELQRQLFSQKIPFQKPVNIIDEAFILELINSLQNPSNPSMNAEVVNAEVFYTNAIQAGAKMVSQLNKTMKCSLELGNGARDSLLPDFVNILANDESLTVNKVFSWLSSKTGMDTSQFQFLYSAENSPMAQHGGNGDIFHGLPGSIPQTPEQLLFGIDNQQASNGTVQSINTNPLNDALSKLAGTVGVQMNTPQTTGQTFTPAPAAQPFAFNQPQPPQNVVNVQFGQPSATLPQMNFNPQGTVVPAQQQVQQPNLIDQYNQALNNQTQQQTNQNQGGNNMFTGQPQFTGLQTPQVQPQGVDILISCDPTQLYTAYPNRVVNTAMGPAVEVYSKGNMLSAYALSNGQVVSLQGQIVGTAQVYQAPPAQQFNQFVPQPQLGLMSQQPQFNQFVAQPQLPAMPQQFNAYATPVAAPQFAGFQSAQPTFGQQDNTLRQNPLFGLPQKVMSFI